MFNFSRQTDIRFLVRVPYWQHSSPKHSARFFGKGSLRMTVLRKRNCLTLESLSSGCPFLVTPDPRQPPR